MSTYSGVIKDGAFSVIMKTDCETDGSSPALVVLQVPKQVPKQSCEQVPKQSCQQKQVTVPDTQCSQVMTLSSTVQYSTVQVTVPDTQCSQVMTNGPNSGVMMPRLATLSYCLLEYK